MAGVFEGLRVLDLSCGIAGAMSTMLLADNGADVTRIVISGREDIDSGHSNRVWDRGKRSARIDVGSAEGLETLRALISIVDVIVESFPTEVAAELGIDHATTSKTN